MKIHAYAANKAKGKLVPFVYDSGRLGAHDAEIEITHCGICHSDIHLIDNDWKGSRYPLVPGHEIVGTVKRLGPAVRRLAVGQRVGVGWQCGACGSCDCCVRGDENLCGRSAATCYGNHGGFADARRVDSRFAFPIPDSLDSAQAAPLLCGGITVYSPLAHYGVRPSMRVGVIGVGGLGHLALRFARAFGCEVTAFSGSPDKEGEAMKFGAHRFVPSRDKDALASAAGSLDFLLATVPADLDWAAYMGVLRPDGRLCFVGAIPSEVSLPVFSLIAGRKSVCGSPIGGRRTIREMLEFAARHRIGAQVETLPMARANEGVQTVRRGKPRFRIVLTN
ncbi:MAG: NAD(P)-dependent alcohol dehydrogenase [Elusimicrobiota bacterium]